MKKNILPADVAKKYDALIEPTELRFQKPVKREIDLRTMSLEDAAWIAEHHPEILVKKQKPTNTK